MRRLADGSLDHGRRHRRAASGNNGFCAQIGNDSFTWFGTRACKSCYADLRAYCAASIARWRSEMRARFDHIFCGRTGFVTLDRLLQRFKISGGTHSSAECDCRDAFLGLMHTCCKLDIPFWDCLTQLRSMDRPCVAR